MASCKAFLLVVVVASALQGSIAKIPAIFSFGDSTVDVGTNNHIRGAALANMPPYGRDFIPSRGSFSNGRLVGDYLAAKLHLPIAPPYLKPGASFRYGANFASGGSGITDIRPNTSIPLSKQLDQFAALRAAGAAHNLTAETFGRALYIVSAGGNDFYVAAASRRSYVALIQEAVTRLAADIQTLYRLGARKIVVFEMPALGCIPYVVAYYGGSENGGCISSVNQLAQAYNLEFSRALAGLRIALPYATILLAHSHEFVTAVVKSPSTYGFWYGTDACCGGGLKRGLVWCGTEKSLTCRAPGKFVFWDAVHPSQQLYKLLADRFFKGPTTAISPINVAALAKLA
eukprot:jgi/Mesen1/6811/ME000035S06191